MPLTSQRVQVIQMQAGSLVTGTHPHCVRNPRQTQTPNPSRQAVLRTCAVAPYEAVAPAICHDDRCILDQVLATIADREILQVNVTAHTAAPVEGSHTASTRQQQRQVDRLVGCWHPSLTEMFDCVFLTYSVSQPARVPYYCTLQAVQGSSRGLWGGRPPRRKLGCVVSGRVRWESIPMRLCVGRVGSENATGQQMHAIGTRPSAYV